MVGLGLLYLSSNAACCRKCCDNDFVGRGIVTFTCCEEYCDDEGVGGGIVASSRSAVSSTSSAATASPVSLRSLICLNVGG